MHHVHTRARAGAIPSCSLKSARADIGMLVPILSRCCEALALKLSPRQPTTSRSGSRSGGFPRAPVLGDFNYWALFCCIAASLHFEKKHY